MFIDDLPSATMIKNDDEELEADYKEGLYIGRINEDGSYVIYNHLDMVVKTHEVSNGDELRIVGFEIHQRSVRNGSSLNESDIKYAPEQYLQRSNGDYDPMEEGILFSYSIKTINDESTEWSHRMDHYFAIGKYDVHMK